MDYPFYLAKIGQLPPHLVDYLRQQVLHRALDSETTFWDQEHHRGISGVRYPKGDVGYLSEALWHINTHLADSFFLNYEVDVLDIGGHIKWHTDVTTIGDNRCSHTHRVHLPLTGAANYLFQRGSEVVQLTMDVGGIYLFNNAVMHSVEHVGHEPRINIMVNYKVDQL